jgi:hypothetical protein
LDRSFPAGEALRGRVAAGKISGRRLLRASYVVLVAVLVGLTISFWSWVDAQARAVVVISSVLDAPAITPAVRATSGDLRLSDTRVAGYLALS